jgi:DNA-binding CsgD family transcriptional regulator/tetratricopeptide (TPR) repeat protein
MVGMPKLPSEVAFTGPQHLFSDRWIQHGDDGTAGVAIPHGRQPPKLGIRATDLSLSSTVATELLEREVQLAALDAELLRARAGLGGVVVVSGEAGIGKSALVSRFVAGLDDGDTRALVGSCDDLSIPRALAPFRDLTGSVAPVLAEAIARGAHPHEIYPLLLDELDGPRPTVLVLEDVHWADDATLDAANFLVRRIAALPALLIITLRDAEAPCADALHPMLAAAATAQGTFVQLQPLSQAAVATIATGAAADVYAATGGNPFLITELLCSDDGTLPATVANAVLGRVARLDEPSRALVELLSVVPGRVPTPILDLASPGWAAAAEDPERRKLLEVTPKHVLFRHELVRQAVRASISAAAAREYNARIVAALLVSDGDPADIVHHAEHAGLEDVVADHVLRAARRAAALESRREAYAHYRRALDFIDDLEPREQASLHDELSAAAYFTGRLDEALEENQRAIDMHLEHGDVLSRGRCMRVRSRLQWFAGDGQAAHASARDAIAILEPLGPSVELATAYSTLSRLAMLRRDVVEAEAWGNRALTLANRFGDTETRVQSLVTLASARLVADPEAAPELVAAHDAADEAGEREEAQRALANLSYTLMSWARAPEAAVASARAIAYAEKHEVLHMAPYSILTEAWLQLRAGAWATAGRTAKRYAQSGVKIHRLLAETVLTELAVRRGDDDALTRLESLSAEAERTGELQRLVPVLELSVERALLTGKKPPRERLRPQLEGRTAPYGEDVVRIAAYGVLAGLEVELPAPTGTPWEPMLRGDWRGAADAFEAIGWQYDRALMLSVAGDEQSLVEAIAIAQALGAEPLARRVAQQLRELGLRVPRGPRARTRANRAGLTGRQLEVLSLLNEGLTNAEIADRLVVSPRTAEHHVAAVLQKLGAPTRRDAVRRAAELGLAAA